MNPFPKIKCPKCGDESQLEILHTWGIKYEILCNTCSSVSIVKELPNEPN